MLSEVQSLSVISIDFILIRAVWALGIAEFLLFNTTDHGYFSSETEISIEISAMCVNDQFWKILKNLFESLNQSRVSMTIAESSKDVNPGTSGCHHSFVYLECGHNELQSGNHARERRIYHVRPSFWHNIVEYGRKRLVLAEKKNNSFKIFANNWYFTRFL